MKLMMDKNMDFANLNHKIKLIALDLDGTTLRTDKSISDKTKAAISKAHKQGVIVAIASGRPATGIISYAKELNLSADDYCICLNGTALFLLKEFLVEDRLIFKESFNPVLQVSSPFMDFFPIYKLAKSFSLSIHAFSVTRSLLLEDDNPWSLAEAKYAHLPIKYCDFSHCPQAEEFYKYVIVGDGTLIDKLRQSLSDELIANFDVARTDVISLEFVSKRYNKGLMLQKLCELLHINKQEVMAFGDAENDLALIQSVGYGVAMGNAMDVLKQHACYITKTNDEDGVAFVLDQIFKDSDV